MTTILRLPVGEYIPDTCPPYVDAHKLWALFAQIAFEGPTFFVGPKGVGKSLLIRAYAHARKYPLVTVDCSEDLRRPQLVGAYTLRGDETPFVLGPLATAVDLANEAGAAILVLEEVNALTQQAQKLLNPLTDFRQTVEVPEAQAVYRLAPGKRLWVVGTLNTADYGGVYQLNEDLVSRVRMIRVPYPSAPQELELLQGALSEEVRRELPVAVLDRLVRLAQETRQRGGVDYALSPRDLVMVAQDLARLGLPKGLRLLLGKYDGDGVNTLIARIRSIFHIDLALDPEG